MSTLGCSAPWTIWLVRNFSTSSKHRSSIPSLLPSCRCLSAAIRQLFTAEEIREYLDHLEHTKYLAPQEPDIEIDDLDDEDDDEPWLENPLMGAEELLRFCQVRQLLQE